MDAKGASFYNANISLPTNWREELVRVDHNINEHNRATFRYIHDSWTTLEPGSIWDTASFPTSQTFFTGPGVSVVARLTSTISPTLLNEFVASYTTDHISFASQGYWKLPSGFPMGYIYNNGAGGKLPAINISGGNAYGGGFGQDPEGIWPEGAYNSNPTYTYRDNLTKIVGRHNLQFGAYFVAAQKNELSSVQVNGSLTFDNGSPVSSGNAFADMLLGNIASFSQGSNQLKFYNRYKIVEPYFQDDWRVTDRLTLNLGVRVSLFGTYRDKYKHAYNWDPNVYNPATAPVLNSDGSVASGNQFDGLVQCGVNGVPVGCLSGHLFNPAPRVGFAWDPQGNGKTAIRGGYGIFFEHANGNEADTEGMEGQSSPLLQSSTQLNIGGGGVSGYPLIGTSAGSAAPSFPLSFFSIPNKAVWPYMQQWHFDVQHELPGHTVMTVSYVGSKGTKLGRQLDLNQLYPVAPSQNPYAPGQVITAADCGGLTFSGANQVPIATPTPSTTYQTAQTGGWATNLAVACGNDADFYRPFQGIGTITRLENKASSNYNALQASGRKSIGKLNLTAAYTYSHSIDDSSDRGDGAFVNSYNPALTRASSAFDERHILNFSWVYDLPFFTKPGMTRTFLGGWQWSGIETYATGIPITIANGSAYGDNAGVGNGVGTGSFPDLTGVNPNSNLPGTAALYSPAYSKFIFNPAAFEIPQGLTFGDAGRNSVRNPSRLNFDMALFKRFQIREAMGFEFRAEAFNIFNHTEPYILSSSTAGTISMSCPPNPGQYATNSAGDAQCLQPGGGNLGEIGAAHLARVLQLALKFTF